MIYKYILPLFALGGLALGILAAVRSASTLVPTPMVSSTPAPPAKPFVAGAGLVEANTENIAIVTQIAGIVSRIDVRVGSQVRKGDALFTIDDRAIRAFSPPRRRRSKSPNPNSRRRSTRARSARP